MKLSSVLVYRPQYASRRLLMEMFEARCKFVGALFLLDSKQHLRIPTLEEYYGIGMLVRDDETPKRSD